MHENRGISPTEASATTIVCNNVHLIEQQDITEKMEVDVAFTPFVAAEVPPSSDVIKPEKEEAQIKQIETTMHHEDEHVEDERAFVIRTLSEIFQCQFTTRPNMTAAGESAETGESPSNVLVETCTYLSEMPDYTDIISNVLMELLHMPMWNVQYASECFERADIAVKVCKPQHTDFLQSLRNQMLDYSIYWLKRKPTPPADKRALSFPVPLDKMSVLTLPILHDEIRYCYFVALVWRANTRWPVFVDIFTPLLHNLQVTMMHTGLVNCNPQPGRVLGILLSIRRPIATLVPQLAQFLPKAVTTSYGRELSRCSFLGPFLSASCFAEDDPRVVDQFFPLMVNGVNVILQDALDTIRVGLDMHRVFMHEICHNLFANTSSRESTIEYFATLLRANEKRCQLLVEERTLASDGFMLNVLSVLQRLSLPVTLDRVDPMHIFRPCSVVDIKGETRLRFSQQEVDEWFASVDDTGFADKPNFPTQCWFLTLHCHHLALLPAIQKYQRRLRVLRELEKLIEDMMDTEAHWRHTPFKLRNRQMVTRWNNQQKRLIRYVFVYHFRHCLLYLLLYYSSKACADACLLDRVLLRRCMTFYTSVAEFLLAVLLNTRWPIPASALLDLDFGLAMGSDWNIQPMFAALPEWYVEDIAEFLHFALQ